VRIITVGDSTLRRKHHSQSHYIHIARVTYVDFSKAVLVLDILGVSRSTDEPAVSIIVDAGWFCHDEEALVIVVRWTGDGQVDDSKRFVAAAGGGQGVGRGALLRGGTVLRHHVDADFRVLHHWRSSAICKDG
jgi:hypothetical protein